jgi:hypothetical protein
MACRAGWRLQFTEALTHGTLPWTSPSTRTTLFYKYTPRDEAWSPDDVCLLFIAIEFQLLKHLISPLNFNCLDAPNIASNNAQC